MEDSWEKIAQDMAKEMAYRESGEVIMSLLLEKISKSDLHDKDRLSEILSVGFCAALVRLIKDPSEEARCEMVLQLSSKVADFVIGSTAQVEPAQPGSFKADTGREAIINVAKDFSKYPGGRNNGERSGEMFRKHHLEPACAASSIVTVELDGTSGYGSSFLDEAFGGLSEEHRDKILLCTGDLSLVDEINGYLKYGKAK